MNGLVDNGEFDEGADRPDKEPYSNTGKALNKRQDKESKWRTNRLIDRLHKTILMDHSNTGAFK